MRRMMLNGLAATMTMLPVVTHGAHADPYIEYPAPEAYPFRRSTLTARRVVIPPYDRPFRVRGYTTPPRQPFYNVPPYGVITPY